jgi:DNA-binding response OmpR family regulator
MKILIAEDDPHILEGLNSLLSKEGYQVVTAENGGVALEKYSSDKPDFILLDIMMPQVNGYDVCRKIRGEDEQIPILFLSAKSEEIDRVLGLELGADDFISKPFGTRELLARIRTVSRRVLAQKPKAEQSESFFLRDVEVLPLELRARTPRGVVDLSPRDVAILRLFFEKKDQVVDRNELFNIGWGVDFIGSTRSLDQHISQLRKKIEVNPAQPEIIRTVHGAGYRYE